MTELQMREQIQLDAGVLNDPLWQGSRITNMINQAQRWLQLKLIKQGSYQWKKITTGNNIGNNTYQNIDCSSGVFPSDILYEMPVDWILPATGSTKPAKEIMVRNVYDVVMNGVTAPSIAFPVFVTEDRINYHLFPRLSASETIISYTGIVTAMVFDNDSAESEIPLELQDIVIERVVMQIKSAQGDEQTKQAKYAEIDNELTKKYQLDALKVELQDKKVTE
jgi:hypothetical protein